MSERRPVAEARLRETENGLVPDGDGWFVLNVADAPAYTADGAGHAYVFAGQHRFPHFGFNIRVLEPGQPGSMYHAEDGQETFLVIAGECLLLVEGEERSLRQWDLFYAAPGTAHTFVGAGDGPCVIVMAGARNAGDGLLYPTDEVARGHGAAVERTTADPAEAYAGWERPHPARRPWPPESS